MPVAPAMPKVSDLVAEAIIHTDFVSEIGPNNTERETYRAATIATDQVCESWEDANGHPIGATVVDSVRNQVALSLVAYADKMVRDTEDKDAAALAWGVECGDLDRDGRVIPYDRYMSA